MNAIARTIVVVLVALACWASGGASAAAHTALTASDPANGATEGTAPNVVTLTFTEEINPTFAIVVISSSDGRNWTSGPPQVAGPELRVSASPDMPDGGEYKVGYRVVSEDGHPVSGSIAFTVAGVPGAAAPAPQPTSASPTTTAASPTSSGALGSDTKGSVITAAVAGLLLGGAIAFWQSRRHRRKDVPRDEPPSP
jgi:methionine-rich copper-binding protein CopC